MYKANISNLSESMATKKSTHASPCAKYKVVLDPLRSRLEEVLREKSHVVALQCCLRGEKHAAELRTLLKTRYKHLYECELNCRAIHGKVCGQKKKRNPKSTLSFASETATQLAVAR